MARQQSPRDERTLERDDDLFELVSDERAAPFRPEGIVVGVLVEVLEDGTPLVDFVGNPQRGPVAARSTVPVEAGQAGREVALLFEGADPERPIAIGLMHQASAAPSPEARVDRERLVLEAEREIELRCGKASITLTRDGKVRIHGTDLLTRSSGGNRIKGGSVRIN